jgi:hypothetical protein
MPSQLFPQQVTVPEFRQLVLYTGNVMRTAPASPKQWNKKSNTEVCLPKKKYYDGTMITDKKKLIVSASYL